MQQQMCFICSPHTTRGAVRHVHDKKVEITGQSYDEMALYYYLINV